METRVRLNVRERSTLEGILGAALPGFDIDFERDVLDRLDRGQLLQAISSLRSVPELERLCCLRLENANPSSDEVLLLAQSMNEAIALRAKERLLENAPSPAALEYLVLAGSSPDTMKERAAEIILGQPAPHPDLLQCIVASFEKGAWAIRAWRVLATLEPDKLVLTRVLRETKEPSIARGAWECFERTDPSIGDVSHVLSFCSDEWVRNRAADRLLSAGLNELDRLSYVLSYATEAALRDEAARRILAPTAKRRKKPDGDHLSSIVLHAKDGAFVEQAWAKFAGLRFTARDEWNLIHLRNILCGSNSAEIRKQAFVLAKAAPFNDEDRAYIAEHARDAHVREAFRPIPAG